MVRSKILYKAFGLVVLLLLFYIGAISCFTLPKIDKRVEGLEKKNAELVLDKVVSLSEETAGELDIFKKRALQRDKEALKKLTDTAWSVIEAKYEQSYPQNIGMVLKERAKDLNAVLNDIYDQYKDKLPKAKLKKKIIEFVQEYRFNNGVGYFWINDFQPKMIMHPIIPTLNGKDLSHYKDPNGVYLFNDMVKKCRQKGSGIVKYQWMNPKTKKVEDKISYVFTFKPFHWIIGTGEYYSVLNKQLKDQVFKMIAKIRYGDNNYFFINNYKNEIVSHPFHKLGKQNKRITALIDRMNTIAKTKGEGFLTYYWKKTKDAKVKSKKLSFIKNFPNWKIVIGTGIYIDDIDKEMKKGKEELLNRLRKIMKTTKIGESGYIYAVDKNGVIVMHQNKNLVGKNLKNLNASLFDTLVHAARTSGVFSYKWDKPDDEGNYIYNKISWVRYIPKMKLYVCASVYEDEFEAPAILLQKRIIVISIIMFFLSFLLGIFFFRKLLHPLSLLSEATSKVAKGDYSVRVEVRGDDELGALAKNFNSMAETIENNIKNLDAKVQKKTKELQKLNRELEVKIKEVLEENTKQLETLQQQSKLASMGEMIGAIAHQWRQPLNEIAIAIQNLKYDFKNGEIDEAYIQNFIDENKKVIKFMSKTIDDFRDFFRIDKEKEDFKILEAIQSVVSIQSAQLKNHHITLSLDGEEFVYNGLKSEFQQVILNLVNNAKDVLMEKEVKNPTIAIEIKKGIVTVCDNGGGIPKEIINRIFEPYFTTKEQGRGTGMGLYVSKMIIEENMGGRLRVENRDGGACFIIELGNQN